jgi:hypothetical protein
VFCPHCHVARHTLLSCRAALAPVISDCHNAVQLIPLVCGQVEDLSNLLNTGEVPNLFDVGDVIAIGES